MTENPHLKKSELDARTLRVRFAPPVIEALRSLTASVSRDVPFDADVYHILREWSSKGQATVHDILIALPLIAEEIAPQIAGGKNQPASDAWRELCIQMSENGFSVSQSPRRGR